MNAFYVGGIIGFGPALFLIWFSLRKYSYPYVEGSLFEDRKVFFLLAVGMVAGTFLFTLERFLYPFFVIEESVSLFMFILIYVLAFPFLEDIFKFVVINYKGYQGRFDSTFYGLALGAGYSATAILGYVIIEMARADSSLITIAPESWIGLIFFSACTALIHCSVGATLGNSTGKNLGLRGMIPALIPHMAFNLLMFPWFVYGQLWYSLIIVIPFSVLVFHNVYTHIIPESLPPEIQKEMRRNIRKRIEKRQ
ncbi:MAG: hypothetical protein KKH41_06170 [Candidatus Thermoplasmatota archaeon]|nr:hypothetical protein [Euryarchaeota archaeon]MBU4032343.1 hypothetical protein [Candidatus Thermoplasmatota archaeon]MBU4071746.1 hypothetical protein [Candidatus Thermoplasmatota archaeon]MBU4144840.1 hypothetical protein [Candidatus Thermoplasmatota archaeon]MBU4592153.1 hypothetical protein [Candidatus Thermoplasmatota archaeon]